MATKEERDYKSEVLGIPISTANSKLRKILLFKYVQKAKEDTCYRCGKIILSIEDFSIEHKNAWLHSPNGRQLFFDTNNIAFSHIACNSGAEKAYKNGICHNKGKPSQRRKVGPAGTAWCGRGQHFQSVSLFVVDNTTWNKLKWECNTCRSDWRKERYRQDKSR